MNEDIISAELQDQPENVDVIPTYRKWVALLVAIFLSGSAHFFAGHRIAGLRWYATITVLQIGPIFILFNPGMISLWIAILVWLCGIVAWIVMLRQSYRLAPRIGVLGFVLVLMIYPCLNYGVPYALKKSGVSGVEPFVVPGRAMVPTIMSGDRIIVNRLAYKHVDPQRGDVVGFKTDKIRQGRHFVMRVVGLPGDTVRIDPPRLIVNGQPVTEPPIFEKISSAEPPYQGFQFPPEDVRFGGVLSNPSDEIQLAEGEYFVLGDNPDLSNDSRFWGPVPRENIYGKATRIYWPWDRVDQSLE